VRQALSVFKPDLILKSKKKIASSVKINFLALEGLHNMAGTVDQRKQCTVYIII
jgi:hypothetical protein